MSAPRTLGAAAVAAALLAVAACGGGGDDTGAPWLTMPTLATHAAFLPLLGTPHDPTAPGATISCNSCHAGPSFTTFDCTGCHTPAQTDPIHLGVVAGYGAAPGSAACYRCHPQGVGVMSPAAHAQFFAIGTASHPAVCSTCHADPARRSDLGTLGCAACHAAQASFFPGHAAVKDCPPSPTSADCLSCHADDQVHPIADHQARFPITAGSATHDTACLHCHTTPQAARSYAADFTAFDCTACHGNPATDTAHAGVAGYGYASSACYQCHPGGTAAPANHASAFFPIGVGTAHDGVTCTQCHTDLSAPPAPTNFACASCHQALSGFATAHAVTGYAILVVHSSQTASTPVDLTSQNCLLCHGDAQVDRVASHPGGSRAFGTGPHRTAGCLTCHAAARTDKPFAAEYGTTPGCVVCHPNGIPN